MKYLSLLIILTLGASPAWAHKFKVFAFAEGDTIEGEAYFVGAGKAPDAEIALFQGNTQVKVVRSDKSGAFLFKGLAPADYEIRADAGQGHAAIYSVSAEEMGADEGAAAEKMVIAESSGTQKVDSRALSAVVDKSIARQLRPLREQIERMSEARRMQDILGGVGYIFGLAGLASLILGRKRQRQESAGAASKV